MCRDLQYNYAYDITDPEPFQQLDLRVPDEAEYQLIVEQKKMKVTVIQN